MSLDTRRLLSPEFRLISSWIEPNSRVLDLGCGDGTLLAHLQESLHCSGYGLELDPQLVTASLRNGINVIQTNLNRTSLLDYFDEDSFDYIIMTQALQVVKRPDLLLDEMLTIGRQSIVTFPNFGHWRNRLQLLLGGRMPENDMLPHHWYDTPNIHLCTFRDFEALCAEKGIEIVRRAVVDQRHQSSLGMKLLPNLLGEVALYQIRRKPSSTQEEGAE